MKFKKGDKVKYYNNGEIHIRTVDHIHGEEVWFTNGCWLYERHLELVKEERMKTTITLRELIEQGACKKGVLWFMDWVSNWRETVNINTLKEVPGFCHDYKLWLDQHGYQTEDKDSKIAEIKEQIESIKEKLKELNNE